MLNFTVQVVARPRPHCATCPVGAGRGLIDPAEALVGGIFGGGIHPGIGGGVRHLFEEPVLVVVALADGVGDVVGEEAGVAQRPAPEPVVVAVAFEELVGGAVGIADLPDLLAVADGLPVEFAEVERSCRLRR